MGYFVEMCRRKGLKANADKSEVIVLNGKEELEYEVNVEWICLQHVSEFKYLGCVLDKSSTDEVECSKKVENWRRNAGAIRSH